MGTGSITTIADGTGADAADVNQYGLALKGDLVPRNSSGVPESGAGECGTLSYPWAAVRATTAIINGQAIDPDLLTTKANRIVSGATRTASAQAEFPGGSGSGGSATLLATTTNLVYSIAGTSYTLSSDLALSGLTLAPTTNNTCLVNDTTMAGATADKYVGERNTVLNIDTAGTEITARVGQMVALKGATEILFGYLKSTTQLVNCYRGFFFDSSGAPIVREALSNNDTLTLMEVGYVFLQTDMATYDVTYTTPVLAYSAPGSPVTGDYWLDQINQVWKRWSGSAWVDVNRTLVGVVVMDGTNCIASRSLDPYISYSDTNTFSLKYKSASQLETDDVRGEISVYGVELDHDLGPLVWDMASDLETGLTEASSTTYYAYLSMTGQRILGTERPYWRADLQGYYHPYHAWRCVGNALNDGSSDFNVTTVYGLNSLDADYRESTPFGAGSTGTGVTGNIATFTPPQGEWDIDVFFRGFWSIAASSGFVEISTSLTSATHDSAHGGGMYAVNVNGQYASIRTRTRRLVTDGATTVYLVITNHQSGTIGWDGTIDIRRVHGSR